MSLIDIIAVLVTLAAVFSWINHRFIRLPVTIGVMLIALLMSLAMLAVGTVQPVLVDELELLLRSIDFDETVLHGMLSFLLFAGALHINLGDLERQKGPIAVMASAGLLLSAAIVGLGSWWLLGMFGMGMPLVYCLLFGALISPTDPIAVLGILKTAGAPKSLETKIAGESLFNDGVAVVAFLILLEVATGRAEPTAGHVAALLGQEVLGGAAFGLLIGWIAYTMLRSVDNYQVEVLITLGLVTGGYALAMKLHLSAPIAIVVAGLLIGNQGRRLAMSDTTREHLDTFWELVDEVLNAVLFVLLGLEVLVLTFTGRYLMAGLAMIPLVLLARFIAVGVPVTLMRRFRAFSPGAVKLLTWGGLRGGISVALALSLPAGPQRDLIIAITYAVVVFSIVVQGLTVGPLIRLTLRDGDPARLEQEIEA
ncbi:MAG TPA: sodium:proton antiporter [Thermoanaerobaculia bacterium]|nr:sodium:proton antiporter [Thermoanaerobaculia bacterium]